MMWPNAAADGPEAEATYQATSPRSSHIPVAAFRIQVWRVTRIIVLIRWAQPVPARASPTAKTSVVRFS